MSYRHLKRLVGPDNFEIIKGKVDDDDIEEGSSDEIKPKIYNTFAVLENSSSADEIENVQEERLESEQEKPLAEPNKCKKKRRKKKGKQTKWKKVSIQDDDDDDEILNKAIQEKMEELAKVSHQKDTSTTNNKKLTILKVNKSSLNPTKDLKRMFGASLVKSLGKRSNRGCTRLCLMLPMKNWPDLKKTGFKMSVVSTDEETGKTEFEFSYEPRYKKLQETFEQSLHLGDFDNNALANAILTDDPYHVDTLIQVSEQLRNSGEHTTAATLIERALYALEMCFSPIFEIGSGNCTLSYRKRENRTLFVVLLKYALYNEQRSCFRTALEFCKFALSLDLSDPLAVILSIDLYAIRSKEYRWLLEFVDAWGKEKMLMGLPNYKYSTALAKWYLKESDADDALQEALLEFPGVYAELRDKCFWKYEGANYPYFSIIESPPSCVGLCGLYATRTHPVWIGKGEEEWLRKNVQAFVKWSINKERILEKAIDDRVRVYKGPYPKSIRRHAIVCHVGDELGIRDFGYTEARTFNPSPPSRTTNSFFAVPMEVEVEEVVDMTESTARLAIYNRILSYLDTMQQAISTEGEDGGEDEGESSSSNNVECGNRDRSQQTNAQLFNAIPGNRDQQQQQDEGTGMSAPVIRESGSSQLITCAYAGYCAHADAQVQVDMEERHATHFPLIITLDNPGVNRRARLMSGRPVLTMAADAPNSVNMEALLEDYKPRRREPSEEPFPFGGESSRALERFGREEEMRGEPSVARAESNANELPRVSNESSDSDSD